MIFDLLNNASYNYIQRKYYITKMEKSYEYWRIACQRDNRFIILFFYFQNVHTPAAPLDLQGHRIDASLCPDPLLNLMNIAPTITCVSGLICQILILWCLRKAPGEPDC